MIPHRYVNASDNLAQSEADRLLRQEVTVEWYLDNMCDAGFFRWTCDEDHEFGLDPWRYHMDLPIDLEEAVERGWRIFVQRRDMPNGGPVGRMDSPPLAPEMTLFEAMEAAHASYVTKTDPGC